MPLKKRTHVSNGLKQQRNTASKSNRRENESEEQRQSRLLQNRTTTEATRNKRWDNTTMAGSDLQGSWCRTFVSLLRTWNVYVAVSRLGSFAKLSILAPNNRTRNVVYPEALL